MTEDKEPKHWKHITCSFDNTGKRHILPISLLMQLTSLVKEKKDLFATQVLKGSLVPTVSVSSTTLDGQDTVTAGQTKECEQPKKKRKKLEWKPKQNLKKGSTPELQRNDNNNENEATKRKRPNFFVAVQITNPEIHRVAKNIQLEIQKTVKANLRRAIIGVEKFHITLMVMYLPDKEEVQKAAESLDRCVPVILENTCGESITLGFEGLSTFNGGRVLFASPKASQGLDYLHFLAALAAIDQHRDHTGVEDSEFYAGAEDEVSAQMKNNGIVTTDKADKQFNPHLTLLKFDGHWELRKQGLKRVEESQYKPYVNEVFGTQTINSMQLCQMDRKREDGYYFVEHEVFFNK